MVPVHPVLPLVAHARSTHVARGPDLRTSALGGVFRPGREARQKRYFASPVIATVACHLVPCFKHFNPLVHDCGCHIAECLRDGGTTRNRRNGRTRKDERSNKRARERSKHTTQTIEVTKARLLNCGSSTVHRTDLAVGFRLANWSPLTN